jgi:hypothetical protein
MLWVRISIRARCTTLYDNKICQWLATGRWLFIWWWLAQLSTIFLSWLLVLLVEETGGPGENHWPVTSQEVWTVRYNFERIDADQEEAWVMADFKSGSRFRYISTSLCLVFILTTSFIQQTQYFIPVEIDLSVVPARLGIWFFHLSRRTTVIQDLLVRRQFSLVPDNRTNVNVNAWLWLSVLL